MENSKLEYKIGFDQIRNSLKALCLSEGGRGFVDRMKFLNSYEKVVSLLNLTEEFRLIFIKNEVFPSDNYFDMRQELERLRLVGTFISQTSLFDLKSSLITINECLLFFANQEEDKYPSLKDLCEGVYVDSNILQLCNKLIDDKGEFFDDASEHLAIIRSNLRRKSLEVDKQMKKILILVKKEGWTQDDAEVSVRNGRLVIPIHSSNKRKIKGFVHDESQTGQTSYVEPSEIVELNNEIRELELEERREILKILMEFTEVLRLEIDNLINAYYFLSQIDFIRAKAKYALQIRAGRPILENKTLINWFEARHPILEEALARNSKSIVPLRIEINPKNRILIISGPNAGGKSVCLKTVGLLQYMLQCGLLVPMRESSEAGLFSSIFIDIGDEQSIENDLSTYSSHLLSMKNLCKKADKKILFLIDECGGGTDPTIGGAIAESVLEDLNEKQAFGVVTTHYSNLKLLADKHNSIVNGAMLFDSANMRPLYKLSIGKPGSSFAFEIAQTIGLPKQIIDNAVNKIGSSYFDFEHQLQQLEVDKLALKKKEEEVRVADELLGEVIAKYNKLSSDLENNKRAILKQAKLEAKETLQSAVRKIENTISQIKDANADKEKTKKLREEFKQEQDIINSEIVELEKEEKKKKNQKSIISQNKDIGVKIDFSPIAVEDIVKIGDENTFAEVVSVKRNRLEVMSNSVKMNIEKDRVIKIDKKSFLKSNTKTSYQKNSAYLSVIDELDKKRRDFKSQLDLRGERAEGALEKLSQFIDQARLLGEREISVLHGKGDGILKTIIRDYLKTNSEVKTFSSARLEFGGEGITMIFLN